ncbi:MAG: DUF4199 domain-containing protein [Chitinophagaceae bacterium]|nr:DUF4199 domain-containing protein [Chitinophagaceae bacterium]
MKNIKIEIKWAIIFVIITLVWMVLERQAGLYNENIDKHASFSYFFAIPAITLYVFALLDKRKNHYHGTMNYKQGFVTGLIITLFVTVLCPLTQYITTTYIATDYFPNVIKHAVSQGKMTQAEAESFFNLNSYIWQGLLGTAMMGTVTSAIVAIFTRQKVKGNLVATPA